MKYLGIDLGGTNVAAAVVDSEGTILGKVSLPTPREDRKSTRLNSSHSQQSRMPSSA